MSEHLFHFIAGVALMTGAAITSTAAAADLNSRFSRISVGLNRAQVELLMETPPVSVVESHTLGVSATHLRWQEAPNGTVYVVVLMGGHVVKTKFCDHATDC
jgi:hypothetical protein